MYTQIESQDALDTHLQDKRFQYVVLYFYMAPLQCCVPTLDAIQEASRNPQTRGISFLAIDMDAPGLARANETFGVTKVPEICLMDPSSGASTRLVVSTSRDIFHVLRRYCGIEIQARDRE